MILSWARLPSYFDSQVIVKNVQNSPGDDELVFTFLQPGQYDIAFYSTGSSNYSVPKNLSYTIDKAPETIVYKNYIIRSAKISITVNGETEQHTIP